MKTQKLFIILFSFPFLFFTSCDEALEEDTYSTLGPSNFYNSAEDAEALLNGVYANSQGYRDIARDHLTLDEMTTDMLIERGGAINSDTQPIENFNFQATHPYLKNLWNRSYSAIYRANVTIDKVPDIEMDKDRKEEIIAEARFLRALNYYMLYEWFGSVPLVITNETTVEDRPERASKEDMVSFLVSEFTEIASILPPKQEDFGRATQGAANGFLTKLWLNEKQWQNAADAAKKVINEGVYDLYTAGSRADLFDVKNENDNEFIFVIPFPDEPSPGTGNTYLTHAAPPGYKYKYPPKRIFAASFKTRSEFLELFEPDDQRLDSFIFDYENQAGDTIHLGHDDVRSFKYKEDPNGTGDVSGNNFPLLRFSDILLSRAEALNELQGPNTETINLINQVRNAAGVSEKSIADFAGKKALRDFIFDERGREFFTEALRRQDLIRQGTFIKMAKERGKPAADYQVLFPIPQSEIDKNPNLEQNPGYN